MLLRARQKICVEKSVSALLKHHNTLAVAPTGAGKTVIFSAIIGELHGKCTRKTCVLAHRDTLTVQNENKFKRFNPRISTSIVDASSKNWDGDVIFAMVQTLSREQNLSQMPRLDALVIDEAHHATSESYQRIIAHTRYHNPNILILGVTATPNRGDKQGLNSVFNNVSDQITVHELIESGHLVKPRTFVMDLGLHKALKDVRKTMNEYDMNAVADIMNHRPINDEVVRHWQEHASTRKTIIFCSTIQHAIDVCTAFQEKGIKAGVIYGDMSQKDKQAVLDAYTNEDLQVIVNVAVLTEGFDYPPTSCVVLLRLSSYKSTMTQMIGRGLRIVDSNEYPHIIKNDCIVLDFGTSTLIHGSLEDDVNLEGKSKAGEAPYKQCPECQGSVPSASQECSLCGYVWEIRTKPDTTKPLTHFMMTEIDLLQKSNFQWVDMKNDATCFMAGGFDVWGVVIHKNGEWFAIGGGKAYSPRILARGERMMCFACGDDWLNLNETQDAAYKTKNWLNLPATNKQLYHLSAQYHHRGLTKYQASLIMNLQHHRKTIQQLITQASQ
jgi:superfamily II DNA or RNA helicase